MGLAIEPSLHSILLPAARPDKAKHHGLIFFIPGNPGLIDYYIRFFRLLRSLLDDTQAGVAIDVYGKSLAGFHDDDHEPFTVKQPPYVVEHQIRFAYADLLARRIEGQGSRTGQPYDFVVVMGHSVGAYIALEMFARHLRSEAGTRHQDHVKLHRGFLLFPTVTHISKSPSGLWLDRLRTDPFLDKCGHRIAMGVRLLIPYVVLVWIARAILGMSPDSARVTARFLKSRDGVWQALHMAKDELRVIGEDTWDEELWEIPRDAHKHRHIAPKFMFLFGKKDHWVADHLRDQFIASRVQHARREGPSHKQGRTYCEIDGGGTLPHAFCTCERSSLQVAKKVCLWMEQIQDAMMRPTTQEDREHMSV